MSTHFGVFASGAALALLIVGTAATAGAQVCGDGLCDAGEDCENCGAPGQDCECEEGWACDPTPMPAVCVELCGNGICDGVDGEDVCNCPEDCEGVCCGDGECSPGEDNCSCDEDCPGTCCGNGECAFGRGENSCTCPEDCGGGCCGDGVCEPPGEDFEGEDSCGCPQDCEGTCCGDEVCEGEETFETCPGDCVRVPGVDGSMSVTNGDDDDEGCGCRIGHAPVGTSASFWLLMMLALVGLRRR